MEKRPQSFTNERAALTYKKQLLRIGIHSETLVIDREYPNAKYEIMNVITKEQYATDNKHSLDTTIKLWVDNGTQLHQIISLCGKIK
jgi:hypothetical protein